jgi:hypothetical protein
MPAFRICIIVPPGYQHAHAFTDLALLLKYSLTDLGYDCDLTLNTMDESRINILLGYHLLRFDESIRRFRYIPYQLEQLHERQGVYSENVRLLLENAFAVWEYAEENAAFLKEKEFEPQLLVPGYHRALKVLRSDADKQYDVLFYGSLNERRRRVLQALQAAGVRVQALFGVYGERRNRAIEQAVIVLNVHHYAMQIFESVRVSFLLNNAAFVLSEQSESLPYEDTGIVACAYEEIPQKCRALLDQKECLAPRGEEMCARYRESHPMTENLSAVLERTFGGKDM